MAKLDNACSDGCDDLQWDLIADIQEQMMSGYHDPHGADGHTEIWDTGRLHDSIDANSFDIGQHEHECVAGTNVEYAGYVHDGTYKLKARPYIRDAIDGAKDDIRQLFEDKISEAFA